MDSTTKGGRKLALPPKRHKHKLLVEVLDEIPSTEDRYLQNIREEIEDALERVKLKVTWLKSYQLKGDK